MSFIESSGKRKKDTAGVGERSKLEDALFRAGQKLEKAISGDGGATRTKEADKKVGR